MERLGGQWGEWKEYRARRSQACPGCATSQAAALPRGCRLSLARPPAASCPARHVARAQEAAATLASATIFSWMWLGTTSYFSSCIVYCARPLDMPRSVDT